MTRHSAFLHHPRYKKAFGRWMCRLTKVIQAEIEEYGLLRTGIEHGYFCRYVCEPCEKPPKPMTKWEV